MQQGTYCRFNGYQGYQLSVDACGGYVLYSCYNEPFNRRPIAVGLETGLFNANAKTQDHLGDD